MLDLRPTTCRSCGATIAFALTSKGRRMPLDLASDPEGPWTVDGDGNLHRASALTPPEKRHRVHWETCPSAESHRGKRGRS